MSAPVVSVIVTFKDTPPAFLSAAVASVEAQTFREWELILVDDGSGAETARHAESLAARAPERIRCVGHPGGLNHGTPASRNLGARHARGAFLAFLDSDDEWLPTKLEEQLACLERQPDACMVFGRSIYWSSWRAEPGARKRDHVPALGVRDGTLFQPPSFLHAMLRRRVLMPCPSSVMLRAAAMSAVGGFDEAWPTTFEDQTIYVKLALHAPVLAMDRTWARYRIHEGSVMQRTDRARLREEHQRFLRWVRSYADLQGHVDKGFRRTLRLQLLATQVPGASRLLRFYRRAAAVPARLSAFLRD